MEKTALLKIVRLNQKNEEIGESEIIDIPQEQVPENAKYNTPLDISYKGETIHCKILKAQLVELTNLDTEGAGTDI